MRIGIDISQVIYGTGVSIYTKNLVENLLLLDKENEYILFGGSARRKGELDFYVKGLDGNFSRKLYNIPPSLADFVWNRLHVLNIEYLTGKIDIFHSSDWTQPPGKCLKVTTVHDLSPIRYPKLTDGKIISNTKARMRWIKKEVDRIIVPSQATKKDLELLGVNQAKITVIPEASSSFFKPINKSEVDKIKKKYKLSDYILAVGVGERKNSKRLIEAWRKVKGDLNCDLVFVGLPPKGFDIEKDRGIHFLGQVKNPDLRGLYNGAVCLAYPSLYEGFGLPILQAFACGCPVVTSNLSSMPEVAGKAAVLIDPFRVDSIAQGIISAFKSSEPLVKKGMVRVKEFSWKKVAERTLEVYRNLEG